jgi:hypothetical protein
MLISVLLLSPVSGAQNTNVELKTLSWLAGCWEGNYSNGRIVSEQWMKPLGNIMMSMSRTVKNDKTINYEFVRLEQFEDGTIKYIAHPSGQQEAPFTLIKLDGTKAIFENLQHDYPQRIIYHLVTSDSLLARIEGTVNGKEKGSDYPFKRVKCE